MRVLVLAVPLVASATLTGCNGNKTNTTAAAPAPAARASEPTATRASTAPTALATASGTKTCPANTTQGVINGANKCLAPGQICSDKAITSYPQYGYVCENTNGKLILRRK